MKVNYYEVLGVERSASEAAIRDQFRRLAREQHPDRYRGTDKAEAERNFQTLTEAMNVLTNVDKRRAYDSELASGISSSVADPVQIGKVYLGKGMKALQERKIAEAYENFDMAVKHNPNDAKSLYQFARIAGQMPTRIRQAVQAIEAAVLLEPLNPSYRKEAGQLCRKAGLNAKAERHLEEALKWDKDNIEIQSLLADLRQARGDTKDSGKGFPLFRKS